MNTTTGQYWDMTASAFRGCSHASAGCDNCWAEKMAWRHAHNPLTRKLYKGLTARGKWNGKTRYNPGWWNPLLKIREPKVIFFNGMGDMFHEANRPEDIQNCLVRMDMVRQHVFIVATKRPAVAAYHLRIASHHLDNLILLASVEDQKTLEERGRFIAACKPHVAAVGLSAEPLLGQISLLDAGRLNPRGDGLGYESDLDWIVVGGETGPGARPMMQRDFTQLCFSAAGAKIPLWLKQIGVSHLGRTLARGQQFNGVPEALMKRLEWARALQAKFWGKK